MRQDVLFFSTNDFRLRKRTKQIQEDKKMKRFSSLILLVMVITTLSQANLLAWSEPTQITTTGGSGPCLIQDSNGDYWVTFSYSDIYISNSPDGITWGTPTNITNWGNCSLSSLIQDFGGTYRLAFGAGSAEPYKIYVMSSSDGLTWSSPVQVPTVGTSFEPCIIQDSNGKYWLTYNTYWGIYITSSNDFVNWGSSTNIVSGFMAGSFLIQDSAGKYWVAYYYHGGNWPVYITSSSNGVSWASPTQIVSGADDGYYNARNPELIQDSAGTYWMTYGTVDQVGKHDVALISSSDGVSWSSPFIVAGGDSDDGYTSSIIQDQSGTYWVAFPSDRSGDWNIWITKKHVATAVGIDIKPGSYPNTINLGSHGLIPVAILSSPEFDATRVDPETVELAGSGVSMRGKSNKYMAHEEDVNGDNLLDLVVQVATENLDPDSFQDGYAILTGKTYGGEAIEGWDEIAIVPPE